jgi:glyoxylase-like metal-dependent hydrolase (beta-lactamase superfamily II)
MRPTIVLLGLACSSCAHRASAPSASIDRPFTVGYVTVTPLGAGVYAATRNEPLGLAANSNSLFIVNDDHVVVIDAQFTRAATQENISALRRITTRPVRWVINTHWHDDHVAGNQVYRDSFPNVRFLAQRNTREDIIAQGRPNRAAQVQGAPPVVEQFERLLAKGLGPDSTPTTEAERASLTNAIRIEKQYLAENAGFREALPDTVFDRRLTLTDGGRTIELHWFGRGNTRGDAVTYLPKERIVATGDLLVAPIPFAFGSYPTEWIAVLDSVKALAPKVIVPGHGRVMHDVTYLDTVQRMLKAARDETARAVASGLTVDSTLAVVRLETLRDQVAGSEKQMRVMFASFFRNPIVRRAFDEAKNGKLQ